MREANGLLFLTKLSMLDSSRGVVALMYLFLVLLICKSKRQETNAIMVLVFCQSNPSHIFNTISIRERLGC
jgi:hypothetical protein